VNHGSGHLVIGRSKERRRQFPVLERAGRRLAVDAVQDTEQCLEVRVTVATNVNDLVAVLFGANPTLTQRRQRSS
jgi:hypothetical protein